MTHLPWSSGHGARTTAALAAVVLLSLLYPADAAAQALRGSESSTETVTSGSWGAAASPGTMTWTTGGGQLQKTTVSNSGTITLTDLTYTVSVSAGAGRTNFTLRACTKAWNSAGNCPGGATPIGGTYGLGTVTTVTSNVVPPLGGDVYLQATESGAVLTTLTMTLQVSVSSSTQIRAGIVTNQ